MAKLDLGGLTTTNGEEYTLQAGFVWITVDDISIRISRQPGLVKIATYIKGREDEDPIHEHHQGQPGVPR